MSNDNIKLEWEGNSIKQVVKVKDEIITPKTMLDALSNARNQLDSMLDQKEKLQKNLETQDTNIKSAKAFIAERAEFEAKCIDLNTTYLKERVDKLLPELTKDAEMEAQHMIDKDPSAYTEQLEKNQKYVLLQRKLATDKKVAKNVAASIITKYLFEEPIFENPFK